MKTSFALALERENLTAAHVARTLGITRQSVGEWVRGEKPVPPARRVQLIVLAGGSFKQCDFEDGA